MSLGAFLQAELGVALEVPFDDVLDIFEANPTLARVAPTQIRDILLRGAARDGDLGIACIAARSRLAMRKPRRRSARSRATAPSSS